MVQRISLLVYIDSLYKLTIRMHSDHFNDVQKEKFHFFTTHPFSALPHHAHFQTKNIDNPVAFFKYIGI